MTDLSPLSMHPAEWSLQDPCVPRCEDAAVPSLLFHQVLMFSPSAGQGEGMFPWASQGSSPLPPHIMGELLSQGCNEMKIKAILDSGFMCHNTGSVFNNEVCKR